MYQGLKLLAKLHRECACQPTIKNKSLPYSEINRIIHKVKAYLFVEYVCNVKMFMVSKHNFIIDKVDFGIIKLFW